MAVGGFLALLDDIAVFTSKFAVAASDDIAAASKVLASGVDDVAMMAQAGVRGSAAVIVDDIPVSAEAVTSNNRIDPKRELPIVWRILRNAQLTRLVVTPLTMVVSIFAPAAMPLVLGVGGAYLAYEGAEKIIHAYFDLHDDDHDGVDDDNRGLSAQQIEDKLVRNATRTDIIMGTEISFMASNFITQLWPSAPWWQKSISLFVTNTGVAALIYGIVGGLVKMDDAGFALLKRPSRFAKWVGAKLITMAPKIALALSKAGTAAMLWIGGELFWPGIAETAKMLGWNTLHDGLDFVLHAFHHLPQAIAHVLPDYVVFMAGTVGWIAVAIVFAGAGFVAGALVVAIVHGIAACRHKFVKSHA